MVQHGQHDVVHVAEARCLQTTCYVFEAVTFLGEEGLGLGFRAIGATGVRVGSGWRRHMANPPLLKGWEWI